MTQIIPFTTGQQANGFSAFTFWFDLLSGCSTAAQSSEAPTKVPVASAGTFRNLQINLDAAPTAGKSFTFLLRVNGASTGLTLTIADAATSARITGVDVVVAAGDTVSLQQTSVANPSSISFSGSIEFDSSAAGVSIYGGGGLGFVTAGITRYDGALRAGALFDLSTVAEAKQVVAAAGAFAALYGWVSGAPGATNGVTFYLNLNGVRQDGSGGTVNTTMSLVGVAGPANVSFTLNVVPGDVVYVEGVRAASLGGVWFALGVKFLATTDGEAMVAGYRATRNVDAETWFAVPNHTFSSRASDSAAGASWLCGPTAFGLKNPRMLLDGTPPGATTRNVVLRRNALDTTLAMTVANPAVTASAAGVENFADGDRVALRHYGTGGTSGTIAYAWTYVIGPPGAAPQVLFNPDDLGSIGLIWAEAYLPT